MSNTVLTHAEKARAMLLEFTRGGTVYRYTDFAQTIQYIGGTFVAIPSMKVDLPANIGGVNDNALVVTMPLNSFSAIISNGEAQPPIDFVLREWYMSKTAGLAEIIYFGKVNKTVRNYNGLANQVRIEIVSIKSQLNLPLGFPALGSCIWTFQGRGCFVVATPESAQITSINGALIDTSGLTTVATSRYFHRGYVTINGLSIMIRDYITGTQMVLVRDPPQLWLNATGLFTPGCDKLVPTCSVRWGNLPQFSGVGYAMPDYHPVIETP